MTATASSTARKGEGLLRGVVEGYSKIHHDETRHIGYGVWFLRETVAANPEMGDVVRQTLRDLLPPVAASLAPPDTGSDRDFAAIGASTNDIRDFALGGLTGGSTSSACRSPLFETRGEPFSGLRH